MLAQLSEQSGRDLVAFQDHAYRPNISSFGLGAGEGRTVDRRTHRRCLPEPALASAGDARGPYPAPRVAGLRLPRGVRGTSAWAPQAVLRNSRHVPVSARGLRGLLHGNAQVSLAAAVVAPGLTVLAFIPFMGAVSGAHLDPGGAGHVRAARGFPVISRVLYALAQLLGATLAGLSCWASSATSTPPRHPARTGLPLPSVGRTWPARCSEASSPSAVRGSCEAGETMPRRGQRRQEPWTTSSHLVIRGISTCLRTRQRSPSAVKWQLMRRRRR